MNDFKVTKLDRTAACFYTAMGPFFGSRSVSNEVGIHLYDDADKTWFLCIKVHGNVVLGFASVRKNLVSDCYTVEGHRNRRVFSSVLDTLMQSTRGTLRANCTNASLKAFKSHGFVPVRQTKNFTYVECTRA